MDLMQAITKNWSEEAPSYSRSIREDLLTERRDIWKDLILENAPKKPVLDFLDVGTGPGFFPIILTQAGHRVTGIDCVEEMLCEARKNAELEQVSPVFLQADGEHLPFDDCSFDCIISRNVTWTLPDAEQAYREWLRVLRPGGRILIFDANWNIRYHDKEMMRRWQEDEKRYEQIFHEKAEVFSPEAEAYRRSMPMCQRRRPQWDFDAFLKIGVTDFRCKTNIYQILWDEERMVRYRSTPMFLLVVEKSEQEKSDS